jgi:prepilin-type N-terminal cleavage/methylation domain-containing protein
MKTHLPIRFFKSPPARGFSLVEIMVATGIAAVIFMMGFMMITGTIRARGESMSRVRATESARLFFQLLEKDLSTGYGGPFGMLKGFQTPPAVTPATLTMSESVPIASDMIQFYTRNDLSVESNDPEKESPDRNVFVRYYVNQTEHTLCRTVLEDSTYSNALETVPFTTSGTPDLHALFSETRQMLIDYQYWDSAEKKMVPLTWNAGISAFIDSLANPLTPTHIQIRLILFDPFAEERYKNDLLLATGGAPTPDPNSIYRVFTKTFKIPSGF